MKFDQVKTDLLIHLKQEIEKNPEINYLKSTRDEIALVSKPTEFKGSFMKITVDFLLPQFPDLASELQEFEAICKSKSNS
ncbi:MAG: hypothetical protein MRY83_03555 [Flavobacteriales bacterium]|nr:hypothetical protein [Flavobacteriales bacterium]